MGADLYIRSISDPARKQNEPSFHAACRARDAAATETERKAYQRQVEKAWRAMYPARGYFRDPYNGSGMLRTLGLSWWQDIAKLQDAEGLIADGRLFAFLKMVQAAPQSLPTAEELRQWGCAVDDKRNSVEQWHRYHTRERKALIAFIRRAIRMKEAIYASL